MKEILNRLDKVLNDMSSNEKFPYTSECVKEELRIIQHHINSLPYYEDELESWTNNIHIKKRTLLPRWIEWECLKEQLQYQERWHVLFATYLLDRAFPKHSARLFDEYVIGKNSIKCVITESNIKKIVSTIIKGEKLLGFTDLIWPCGIAMTSIAMYYIYISYYARLLATIRDEKITPPFHVTIKFNIELNEYIGKEYKTFILKEEDIIHEKRLLQLFDAYEKRKQYEIE